MRVQFNRDVENETPLLLLPVYRALLLSDANLINGAYLDFLRAQTKQRIKSDHSEQSRSTPFAASLRFRATWAIFCARSNAENEAEQSFRAPNDKPLKPHAGITAKKASDTYPPTPWSPPLPFHLSSPLKARRLCRHRVRQDYGEPHRHT